MMSAAKISSASSARTRALTERRARAGPPGTSPGGVTIVRDVRGATTRRTRRMPIGRSFSSPSAPAGAAGGAGGSGWMRSSGGSSRSPGATAAARGAAVGGAIAKRRLDGARRRRAACRDRAARMPAGSLGECRRSRFTSVGRVCGRGGELAGALAGRAARLAFEAIALALLGGALAARSRIVSAVAAHAAGFAMNATRPRSRDASRASPRAGAPRRASPPTPSGRPDRGWPAAS